MLSQCRLPARGCWGGVGCVEGEGVRGKPTISFQPGNLDLFD